MLRLTLNGSYGDVGSLEMAREHGGAVSDFAAVVYDARDRPISTAVVERYARWSAPVHDLLLRGLAIALCDAEVLPAWERIRRARPSPPLLLATAFLAPPWTCARRLARWYLPINATARATERFECCAPEPMGLPVIDGRLSAWAVLAQLWCFRLTGGAGMPPRRPPVHVPLRVHDGQHYVRFGEFPQHIRVPFRQRFRLAACPVIPGVPDAYYPGDLQLFLGYAPWTNQGEPLP